jgi:membrane protein required for colicin V production
VTRKSETLFMSSTYIDLAAVAIALISGLLAMYRGFSREVLSIASWLAAAGAAAWFVLQRKDDAASLATNLGLPSPVFAQIGAGALIFLTTLIVVHLITSHLSDLVLDSRVGMIDRILGFVFGLARAFVLLLIPAMFYDAAFEKKDHKWVTDSTSYGIVRPAGESLRAFITPRIDALTNKKPEKT